MIHDKKTLLKMIYLKGKKLKTITIKYKGSRDNVLKCDFTRQEDIIKNDLSQKKKKKKNE